MIRVAETIEQSGRRIGQHAWFEMRLFETVGSWVVSIADLEVKSVFAAQSHHHAWHAELWHGLLPSIPDLRTADLIAPADDATRALVDSLTEPVEPDRAVERVVRLYRDVIPRLIAAYRDHLDRTTPVTDGPTIRALHLVLSDEEDDRLAGESLLAGLAPA